MKEIMEILKELDWSPLIISFKTGVVATMISFFLGIFAARKVIKAGPKVRAVADGILTLPLVLPPTVAGFFLLLLFSRRRPIGIMVIQDGDYLTAGIWAVIVMAIAFAIICLMNLISGKMIKNIKRW